MFRPCAVVLLAVMTLATVLDGQERKTPLYPGTLNIQPPHVATDKAVKYDYDIVYVRAPRSDTGRSRWAEVGDPRTMEPGADLMLLHPDGKEDVLVPVQAHESIADPFVSFDGQSVYYAKMHDALKHKGSDIYKIHVPTRKITRLTEQTFTPNTGAADWSKTPLPAWGVYNLGPLSPARRQAGLCQRSQCFQGLEPRLCAERSRLATLCHGRSPRRSGFPA